LPIPGALVPRNLLVTGGAGFIGANFIHFWLERYPDDRIVVLDALTYAGNLSSLTPVLSSPRLTFVQGDIRTPGLAEGLLRDHDLTTVVHLAAESHVDRSIAEPAAFLETNVLGTHVLLQAARKVWLDERGQADHTRFHHVSTDEVYGSLGPQDPPVVEGSRYAPSSPYAASKAASDHLVLAYHRTYGLPISISHCTNNYGPFQFPEKLFPLMIVNALAGRPMPVYGDGLNVRDWLHVHDHCCALERILLGASTGDTYNVAGRNGWTNLAAVGLLCRLIDEAFGANPELSARFPASPAARGHETAGLITHIPDRPGHDRRYALNTEKLERELGSVSVAGLEEGLRPTLAWYLDHPEWWRGVMNGSYREWIRTHYGPAVSF
jgi:dTDP-glucose 4,6-dehydratase